MDRNELYENVEKALYSVPYQFESNINIDGVDVDDIFHLNSTLSASIESGVVETLNEMRSIWDKDGEYEEYSFVRQSQTFPDVILVEHGNENEIPILGIELKSWYLLSKEKEPSFRYKVTEEACSENDILAVFPWSLDDVISGEPEVHRPFITNAKNASKKVNEHWISLKSHRTSSCIDYPDNVSPYPSTNKRICDKPSEGSNRNYGRLARSELMEDYIDEIMDKNLKGKKVWEWINFLS